MRRFWLLLILALPLAAVLATAPFEPAAAQPPREAPEQPDDEAPAPEKLGRLTLTLDPRGHTAVITKVFFTPDSKQLITLGMDHGIRVWDVASGEVVKTLYPPGFGGLAAAALAPDGKRLAVASVYQEGETPRHLIYLLTLPDGGVERVFKGHTKPIKSLSFAGDGKRLASSSMDGTFRIWNPDREEPVQVLKKAKYVHHLALSPDGSRLAGLDKYKSGIIRDLATGKAVAKIDGHTAIAWSPDGKTLATGSTDKFQLWEPDGKLRSKTLPGKHIYWIAFSKDSQTMLAAWPGEANLRATLVGVATGKALKEFQPKDIKYFAGHDGALSPDGRYAATGGGGPGGHEAFLWKMEDGMIHKHLAARSWIVGTGFKGAWSADGKAVSWSGTHARPKPSFHVGELQFGPPLPEKDARRAVWRQGELSLEKVSKYPGLKVLRAGKPVARLELESVVDATLVGKDQAAVAGKYGRFWLFDVNTGKVLRRFAPAKIRSLAPSPDGRFLLTVSTFDQTLRIYSVAQDKPLLSLYAHGQDWVAWTPEGYYAATPGGERLMGWTEDNGIKEMPTFYPAERFRKDLYRPDVIRLLLEKGNLKDALATANAALRKEGKVVPEGIVDPNKLLPPKAFLKVLDQKEAIVKVKVGAVAAVKNQPVKSLRLLLDGRPLSGQDSSVEFKDGKDKVEDIEWIIKLPGEKATGPYQLTVLARGPNTSSLSEAVAVPYINPAKLPVMHVLAIGINKYNDQALTLDAARPDAEDIAANFEKCARGELFRNVFPNMLLDQQATRPAIREALTEMRTRVKANDLVVVFFAGHGLKNKNGFYLLPFAANLKDDQAIAQSCLSGAELRKTLGDFPCQVLLMLDACHAAAFGIQNGKKGVLAAKGFKPATDDLTRELTDNEVGVAVMCAAMGYEKAQEKSGHGLFTRAVVQALNKAEGVSFNRYDSMLYIHHLQAFVFDEVKKQSEDAQHPFLSLPWIVESFPVVKFMKSSSGGAP